MITVVASCPTCGDIHVPARGVTVHRCTNRYSVSFYTFDCPTCGEIRRPADGAVFGRLANSGATYTTWAIPAEALEIHPGTPLTHDDLLDFALQLGTTDLLTVEVTAA